MFSVQTELRKLVVKLAEEDVPYALCGALALAVHGYPRATLDIDLLALAGSGERIRRCAEACGFMLPAAPMNFADGSVRIERWSKAFPDEEDVLMLDVLTLSPEIEREMRWQAADWQGAALRTVDRESLIRLKMLRGNAQDLADVEKLQ